MSQKRPNPFTLPESSSTQNAADYGVEIGAASDTHEASRPMNKANASVDDGMTQQQATAAVLPTEPEPELGSRKKKRVKLNAEILFGKKGLPVIVSTFPKLKFKGKGHERSDLNLYMHALEQWSDAMLPAFTFDYVASRAPKINPALARNWLARAQDGDASALATAAELEAQVNQMDAAYPEGMEAGNTGNDDQDQEHARNAQDDAIAFEDDIAAMIEQEWRAEGLVPLDAMAPPPAMAASVEDEDEDILAMMAAEEAAMAEAEAPKEHAHAHEGDFEIMQELETQAAVDSAADTGLTEEQKKRIEENRRKAEERRRNMEKEKESTTVEVDVADSIGQTETEHEHEDNDPPPDLSDKEEVALEVELDDVLGDEDDDIEEADIWDEAMGSQGQ